MRTWPPDSSVEVSDFTSQGDLGCLVSESPCIVDASVRWEQASSSVEWLAACRDGKPARPTAGHRFRSWMPAATNWYSTGSLRQPDRLWCAGSELDSRTDQQGG